MKAGVRIVRRFVLIGVAVPVMFSLVGCHKTLSEVKLRDDICGELAPDWVKGELRQNDDEVFFVGRGVCYNVFDERAAVSAAREDILQQFASLISTRVTLRSHDLDARSGGETAFVARGKHWFTTADDHRFVRFLPGPELTQSIARDAALFTSGVAGDLIQRDVHFEQWDVREEPVGAFGDAARGAVRYKCWLLMSIPRERLDARIGDFRQLVRDSHQRFLEDRRRAIAWADEARERRIRREEEHRLWAREDQIEDRAEARELRERIMSANAGVVYQVSNKH